jgi:hypothetical protein
LALRNEARTPCYHFATQLGSTGRYGSEQRSAFERNSLDNSVFAGMEQNAKRRQQPNYDSAALPAALMRRYFENLLSDVRTSVEICMSGSLRVNQPQNLYFPALTRSLARGRRAGGETNRILSTLMAKRSRRGLIGPAWLPRADTNCPRPPALAVTAPVGFAPETLEQSASKRCLRDKRTPNSLRFFTERSLHTGEVISSIPTAPTHSISCGSTATSTYCDHPAFASVATFPRSRSSSR